MIKKHKKTKNFFFFSSSIENEKALQCLKPTPTKSHYVFSTCDVRRVIQGSMLIRCKELPDGETTTTGKITRMWIHEVTRVFCDRVVDPNDSTLISNCIEKIVKKNYSITMKDVIQKGIAEDEEKENEGKEIEEEENQKDQKNQEGKKATQETEFTDDPVQLMNMNVFSTFRNSKARFYDEMPNVLKSTEAAESQLRDYNSVSETSMHLILFQFAINHLSRIVRILLIKGGHGLLVGMGGSGRQSLTKLASHIAGTSLIQFEISSGYGRVEWKEDLRNMLMKCGTSSDAEDGATTFLLTDTQIIDDLFIADVNSLLSSGEVPMLFSPAERDMVGEKMRPIANQNNLEIVSTNDLFEYFIATVKERLHVILCFSPVGELLRRAIRKMPSVISCCSLNWFTAWPKEALTSVSMSMLAEVPFQDSIIVDEKTDTTIQTGQAEIRKR